jgi:hypothetical protein
MSFTNGQPDTALATSSILFAGPFADAEPPLTPHPQLAGDRASCERLSGARTGIPGSVFLAGEVGCMDY